MESISQKRPYPPITLPLAALVDSLERFALKRYRLVFGTKSVYADLEGGDTFYIAPFSRSFLLNGRDLWDCEDAGKDPATTVIADLEKITHLMLGYSFDTYRLQSRLPHGLVDRESLQLRTDLSRFKSLKTLSLCCGRSDRWSTPRLAGQVYVEYDIMKFKPMDARDYWSYHPVETAVAIKSHFYENPSEEDIAKGIPEVQLVEVHRLPDDPRRELQAANGEECTELYVSLTSSCLDVTNSFCSTIGSKSIGRAEVCLFRVWTSPLSLSLKYLYDFTPSI